MRVVDAHRRRVLDEARGEVRRLVGTGVAQVVLTVLLAGLALGVAGPVGGLAGDLVWVAVGAMAAEGAGSLSGGVSAWRELRRLRSGVAYLDAVGLIVRAEDRAELVRLGTSAADGQSPAGAR